jgi:hypothetical protein
MRLSIPVPDTPFDPFAQSDEVAEFIENLIVTAEREIRGVDSGPQRMDAVVEILVQSVGAPVFGDVQIARLLAQTLYGALARGLPDNLRLSKGGHD